MDIQRVGSQPSGRGLAEVDWLEHVSDEQYGAEPSAP